MLKGQCTQAWSGLGFALMAGKARVKLFETGQEWPRMAMSNVCYLVSSSVPRYQGVICRPAPVTSQPTCTEPSLQATTSHHTCTVLTSHHTTPQATTPALHCLNKTPHHFLQPSFSCTFADVPCSTCCLDEA